MSFFGDYEKLTLTEDVHVQSARFKHVLRIIAGEGELLEAEVGGSSDSGVEIALLVDDAVAVSYVPDGAGSFNCLLRLHVQERVLVTLAMRVPAGVGVACIHAKSNENEYAWLHLQRPA